MLKTKIGKPTKQDTIEQKIVGTLLYYSFAEDWQENGYIPNYEILGLDEVPNFIKTIKEQIVSLSKSETCPQIEYAIDSLTIDLVLLTSAEKYGELICANTKKEERN